MTLCIPIERDLGLQSPVCAHFGSAPMFLLADLEAGTCRTIPNANQHHGHGMCMPLAALRGESIDAIAVGGIGAGALSKLLAAGIQVYFADQPTAEATMAAFQAGSLRTVTLDSACSHHHGGRH